MPYDLECGHCGYQFVLDADPLPRTVRCTVCGGLLTLAVPRPLALPPAPPLPEPPPAPPKPVPPRPVPGADTPPKARAKSLTEPWAAVRRSLKFARVSVVVAVALSVPPWLLSTFVTPFAPEAPFGQGERVWVAWLIVALLVPIVCHLGAQFRCMTKVPESYGSAFAGTSCVLSVMGVLSSATLKLSDGGMIFGFVFFPLGFTALGLWFAFLVQLGEGLGDRALPKAARAYPAWLVFGLVLVGVLLVAAVGAGRTGNVPQVRNCRAGAGLIYLFLLWNYAGLLRTAVDAIDCRAPRA